MISSLFVLKYFYCFFNFHNNPPKVKDFLKINWKKNDSIDLNIISLISYINIVNKNLYRKIYIWILPVFMLAVSSFLHFLYAWVPNPFFALFSPVNESVWEHLKIVFYPFIFMWLISIWLFIDNKKNIFIFSILGAILACYLVSSLFYLIHGGFGVGNNLWVDIAIEFFSLVVSNIFVIALFDKIKFKKWLFIVSIILLLLFIVAFNIITFLAPNNIPIFMD